MNYKDHQWFEVQYLRTKYLVLCGIEPKLNIYLEEFIYGSLIKDSGWEICIYIDGPEVPNSTYPFGIRIVANIYKDDLRDLKDLKFINLKELKSWIEKNAPLSENDASLIVSGLLDKADLEKDKLNR